MAYREMGIERSLAKVGQKVGKNLTLIEKWSAKYGWVERAKAYDARIAKAAADDEIHASEKANRRHIAESQKLQEKILRYLKDFDPKELKPSDIPQWLRAAVDIERRCMGLDQVPQVAVGVQVNLAQVKEEGILIAAGDGFGDFTVNRRQLIICTRLFPKAMSMLTEEQRAELRRFEAAMENRGRVTS